MLIKGKKYIGEVVQYSTRDQVGVIRSSHGYDFLLNRFYTDFDPGLMDERVRFVIFTEHETKEFDPSTKVGFVGTIERVIR